MFWDSNTAYWYMFYHFININYTLANPQFFHYIDIIFIKLLSNSIPSTLSGLQCFCQPCGQSKEETGFAQVHLTRTRGLSYPFSLWRCPISHRVWFTLPGTWCKQGPGGSRAGWEGNGWRGDAQRQQGHGGHGCVWWGGWGLVVAESFSHGAIVYFTHIHIRLPDIRK